MPLVFDAGQDHGLRHYLFGSTDLVLKLPQANIAGRYPRAIIAGAYSPPFGPIEDHETIGAIDRIQSADPHIVWVGLGAPNRTCGLRSMRRNSPRHCPLPSVRRLTSWPAPSAAPLTGCSNAAWSGRIGSHLSLGDLREVRSGQYRVPFPSGA